MGKSFGCVVFVDDVEEEKGKKGERKRRREGIIGILKSVLTSLLT